MNLWVRALKVWLASLFRAPLGITDESRITLRVWPNDLDVNVHMNNGRYLTIMDLGRLDMILRSGLARLVARRRLAPVLAGAQVRFRRSLGAFEQFTLRTQVLGWDAKWFFIEHRFERRGELVCLAVVRGAFLERGAAVSPAELVGFLGHDGASPPLPHWIADWQAVEAAHNTPA
jgi:acyl-CoA thioesterase FadM